MLRCTINLVRDPQAVYDRLTKSFALEVFVSLVIMLLLHDKVEETDDAHDWVPVYQTETLIMQVFSRMMARIRVQDMSTALMHSKRAHNDLSQ